MKAHGAKAVSWLSAHDTTSRRDFRALVPGRHFLVRPIIRLPDIMPEAAPPPNPAAVATAQLVPLRGR
jgi:hypothetical protein